MKEPVLLVILAGLVLAADTPGPPSAKKDAEQMTGTWAVVKAVRNGQAAAADKINQVKVVIKPGQLNFVTAGKKSASAWITLDPARKPPAIDLVPAGGAYQGKIMPGIYQLHGDDLQLCFAVPGKKRPGTFSSRADSEQILLVLKRAKP